MHTHSNSIYPPSESVYSNPLQHKKLERMDEEGSPLLSKLLSPPLLPPLLLLTPLILVLFKHFKASSSKRDKHLPPGPKPWPILGNIPHFGRNPHVSTAHLAKTYGPLISVRLGTQLLVVGSSPKAATEILKTHDRLLSARHVPQALPFKKEIMDRVALVWASECSDHWKSLRALCRTELFSTKAIESQSTMRERKVLEMVQFIKNKDGEVVSIGEVAFNTVFNMLSNLLFSKDLLDLGDRGDTGGLKSVIWRMMELGFNPNIAEFYPVFAPLDPQGVRKKVRQCTKELYGVWETYIRERRGQRRVDLDAPKSDFLDVFLENGFSNELINWLILELFTAGTDTSTTTIEWTMSELIRNKEIMNKVREELEREVNIYPLKESQVSQLPYLNACVKETLRLHPPAPFLIPHRALETCKVMDYTIPKNSQILVNVWAIGRDPETWEDPLTYKPERFLGSNLDFKGHDYELLPFGSGRRICPGLPMAAKQVSLILASLVHSFDWSLPSGGLPEKLDMAEKFGVTLQKEQPLLLVPKHKTMS